jgi:hypothetical protein
MATRKQTITLGIAVAIAILAMFVPILIAVPLFVLAALLIAWGLQPRRTEESIGRLPFGSSYILKALAKLDSMLSSWSWEIPPTPRRLPAQAPGRATSNEVRRYYANFCYLWARRGHRSSRWRPPVRRSIGRDFWLSVGINWGSEPLERVDDKDYPPPPRQTTARGLISAAISGPNSAIAGLLGTPVDLANLAVRATGLPAVQAPIMGSAWLRDMERRVGIIPDPPARATVPEKIAHAAGYGAAATLLPATGIGLLGEAGTLGGSAL